MKSAWYEKQGAPRDVLVASVMPDPQPTLAKSINDYNIHLPKMKGRFA